MGKKPKVIRRPKKEREKMADDKKNSGSASSEEQGPDFKPSTYGIYGEDAPLNPAFVAKKGDIDSLATEIYPEINIDPSKFTRTKLKALALKVGDKIFKTCCSSDPRVLNQNRLNNLHLLKEIKDDPTRDAERQPYRSWRSNLDRLEKALCAKEYTYLQVNGGQVRTNDALWLRKIVRQCYRPYAVVDLGKKGCEIKTEKATETETLIPIEKLKLSVEEDWNKVIELAKERHKIKAIYKALEHMSKNGEMAPRDVRTKVKAEVLEIEKERERELEQKRTEQRENVVLAFQHQIDRTKSRQDAIKLGLTNIGKQVGAISKALNGESSNLVTRQPSELASVERAEEAISQMPEVQAFCKEKGLDVKDYLNMLRLTRELQDKYSPKMVDQD